MGVHPRYGTGIIHTYLSKNKRTHIHYQIPEGQAIVLAPTGENQSHSKLELKNVESEMKALFSLLSSLMLLALCASCSDDELEGLSGGLPEKGLVIRLSTGGGLETKTTLNSTGAYHHVQEVWAVLYKLKASATDPTDNENYDFVTAENLDWNPLCDALAAAYDRPIAPNRDDPKYESDEAQYEIDLKEYEAEYAVYLEAIQAAGGAYGNGNIQQKDFELHSEENGTLLDAGTYRVLCIGLDDVSGTLYGLKEGDDLNSTIFTKGVTLDKAYATIKDIEQAFEGELFAGWAEFQFEPDNLNIVEVEMKRRVAGVLCYVTDIPRVITDNGEHWVKGIRLVLNTQANNQVHLCRPEQPYEGENYLDFGTSNNNPFTDSNTTVLATHDFNVTETTNPTENKGEIFTWEEQTTTSGAKIKANSLLMGAYLLPLKAPENGATLSVELLGGSNYDKENVTGELLATFNATRSGVEEGDVTSYDILPNYIYHIGNKPEPDGTDKDEPVSLLGQKITVTPKPWDVEYDINVEYPSVPIMPTIVSIGEYSASELNGEILDCIGQKVQLIVRNPVVRTEWYLSTDNEGVYFYNGSEYSTRFDPADLTPGNEVPVTMVITDHAVYNDYSQVKVEEDKRTLNIKLMKAGGLETFQEVKFEQWNALIVEVYKGDDDDAKDIDHYVGFNRYDLSAMEWGFDGVHDWLNGFLMDAFGADYYLYEKDLKGVSNYEKVYERQKNGWESSAIILSHTEGYKSENDVVSPNIADYQWYLGAYYQYYSLFDKAWKLRNKGDTEGYASFFLSEHSSENDENIYWTSSVVESTKKYAWAVYIIPNEGHDEDDFFDMSGSAYNDTNKRTNKYYRRVCKEINKP